MIIIIIVMIILIITIITNNSNNSNGTIIKMQTFLRCTTPESRLNYQNSIIIIIIIIILTTLIADKTSVSCTPGRHGNGDCIQKYHRYGNEVSLAMSADATCRGLRSATDGPFLMQLTRGTR